MAFLRQHEAFSTVGIQVVCKESDCEPFDIAGEDSIPSFWVFTPRQLVPNLRDSFKKTFCYAIRKYSSDELAHAAQLLSESPSKD